ncbi:MAG: alpha/beta fold hydrolase [Planctomycetes bacterium]|jgi:pimeloyl-ACP methyl ester carboxylesterase|nr:alpha/beta fold hydrolase [Planctomycetota bacterium]
MKQQFQTEQGDGGIHLVLLHGMMGEPENWHGVLPHLSDDVQPLLPRFPFFERADSPRTIPDCVEFVKDYIDRHVNHGPVVLGGNSLGGHVSLLIAIDRPEQIAGLVLTGSSGLFERQITGQRGANPSRQWYREKMKEIFYDPRHVTARLVDRVVDTLESRLARRHLVSIAKSAKRDNLADRLESVHCPVLLAWGKQDSITPPDVAAEFHALIAESELVWLNECGHAAMIEQPHQLGLAISDWWRRRIAPPLTSPAAESVA